MIIVFKFLFIECILFYILSCEELKKEIYYSCARPRYHYRGISIRRIIFWQGTRGSSLFGEERAGSSCDFFVRLMFNARNVTADTSTWLRYSQDKCRRRSRTSIRETDSRTAMPVFSVDCGFREILWPFSTVIPLINLHGVSINTTAYIFGST